MLLNDSGLFDRFLILSTKLVRQGSTKRPRRQASFYVTGIGGYYSVLRCKVETCRREETEGERPQCSRSGLGVTVPG